MKTLTLAEALRELKRVDKLLQQRYMHIQRYCSKKKNSPDEIEHQHDYVKKQFQSAKDLLAYYSQVKLALNLANLTASFVHQGTTYTVAEAILRKQYLKDEYTKLYNSFTPANGIRQLQAYHNIAGNLSETELAAANLIPELYYDERAIQKTKEDSLTLMSMIDALIDKTNHQTTIEVSDLGQD